MANPSKQDSQSGSLSVTPTQHALTEAVITGCTNGVYTVRRGRKLTQVSFTDILSWVSAEDLEVWENQNSLDGTAADNKRRRLNANLNAREIKAAAQEEAAEQRLEAKHQTELRSSKDDDLGDRRSAALSKAQARISNLTEPPSLERMRLDSLASMAAQNPSADPRSTDNNLDSTPNKKEQSSKAQR